MQCLCLLLISSVVTLWEAAFAQLAGNKKEDQAIPLTISLCSKAAVCTPEQFWVTIDANWRWIHTNDAQIATCFTGNQWNRTLCRDPETCSAKCALEGVSLQDYSSTYGVTPIAGGLKLQFVSQGEGGATNVGSRLYMKDSENTYKLFRLKNREFTFDVDVSTLGCGLNGALYFVEMDENGGSSSAGAKFGTGYCDAQCPHDVKFVDGMANVLDWDASSMTGRKGACCSEMDVWEANRHATAFTPHPCDTSGPQLCEGIRCGGLPSDRESRYRGLCDKDGCDFNTYRVGDKDFFGYGSNFAVDTSKPMTVITQFVTHDGTDTGELSEIRRKYVQNGRIINNGVSSVLNKASSSISEEYCSAQKSVFGDRNSFSEKGGLAKIGEALERGMVLAFSIWDDSLTNMAWLDGTQGSGIGSVRGPCPADSGKPADIREKYANSYVTFSNIKYGPIDSTYTGGVQQLGVVQSWGENKLREFSRLGKQKIGLMALVVIWSALTVVGYLRVWSRVESCRTFTGSNTMSSRIYSSVPILHERKGPPTETVAE